MNLNVKVLSKKCRKLFYWFIIYLDLLQNVCYSKSLFLYPPVTKAANSKPPTCPMWILLGGQWLPIN